MKTVKKFNKLVGRYVEYPDESELTNKETVVMPLSEYVKKNYGSHVKVRTFSELTPEEQKQFSEEETNEEEENE